VLSPRNIFASRRPHLISVRGRNVLLGMIVGLPLVWYGPRVFFGLIAWAGRALGAH
jgi:hypothetical protein